MLPLALLALLPAQPPAHESANPLYKELLEVGLPVGGDAKAKFPAPSMPDGLDAAKQKAVINQLIAGETNYDEFTRKSVVARELLKIRDIAPSDPNAPARGVDSWFLVHGDFALLEDEKFLDRLLNAGRGGGQGNTLTKDDLAKRKITVADEKRESYGHVEFDFLEKVRLKLTGRTVWTRNGESAVAAGRIDPRFDADPEFPNTWQSIIKEGGQTRYGPAQPYSGAAFYVKLTKLADPAGAVFVEQHVIFLEPKGWFDGANLLRSKLPPAVQQNVRAMRKEWMKGK